MSLIRRCDICNRNIDDGVEFKHINTRVTAGPVFRYNEDANLDICPSCWVLLMHNIKAAQQHRREEAKEIDKMFSDPWDPGMMVVTRRD